LQTAAFAPCFVTTHADLARFAIACVLNLQHAPTLLPGAVVASGVAR
jgi:ligand-binding sensor protein